MKYFEATVAPKKSHPENPDSLSFFSCEHSTAKGFSDEIKAILASDDEHHAFWFNPVVSRITEDKFNEYQEELMKERSDVEDVNHKESMLSLIRGELGDDYDEEVLNRLGAVTSEQYGDDGSILDGEVGFSVYELFEFFHHMLKTCQIPAKDMLNTRLIRKAISENFSKPRISEPESVESCAAGDNEAIGAVSELNSGTSEADPKNKGDNSDDPKLNGSEFYYFQYTPNNPILVMITKDGSKYLASYQFESELFIEIDRVFEKIENAVTFALGLVIDDCLSEKTDEHMKIVKGIGSRGEDAIPTAKMSESDIVMMIEAGRINPGSMESRKVNEVEESCGGFNDCGSCPSCKHADDVKPWESDDSIEFKSLYAAIVDVVASYKGDSIPAVSDCYMSLINTADSIGDICEESLIKEVVKIKNPHNFTNGANVTQIVMKAHPEFNESGSSSEKSTADRIGEKFSEIESTKRDGEECCSSDLDGLSPAARKFKSEVAAKVEAVSAEIESADSIDDSEGMILCDGRRIDTSNLPELKAKFNDNNLPSPNDLFDFGDDKRPDEKEEKSDFEKLVESYNEKINNLELGEVIVFEGMPNEVYHTCDGISSSQIKDAAISLMHFNNKHNLGLIERVQKREFDIGNVFHSIALEPDLTSKEYVKEPSGDGVPKKPTDPQTEKYKAWRKLGSPEKSENPKAYPTPLMFERCGYWGDFYESCGGLYPVASDDWEKAEAMVNSALNDEDSGKILNHPSRRCEVSYFKRCPDTGLIIKCRPDIELGRIIGDLKSISLRGNFDEKYLISALRKEVYNRDYHLSAAMYMDITGKDRWVWIFTNKQDGYHWTATIRATDKTLDDGRDIYLEYKHKIADAYESGIWPKPESIRSKRNEKTGKTELPEI